MPDQPSWISAILSVAGLWLVLCAPVVLVLFLVKLGVGVAGFAAGLAAAEPLAFHGLVLLALARLTHK